MLNPQSYLKKTTALFLTFSMLFQTFFYKSAVATGGPDAPEFSSFESVTTNGMVNEFSGDFTYNLPLFSIPGPDGAGYALSLSYKSGVTPEGESSWVGYGWTLNPGAIIRSKNGFPDDLNGADMISYNEVPDNWTVGLGINAGVAFEGFSLELSLTETMLLQYNRTKGFSYIAVPNISAGMGYGLLSMNLALADGEGSFSVAVNPASALQFGINKHETDKFILKDPAKLRSSSAAKAVDLTNKYSGRGMNKMSNAYLSHFTDNSSRNTNITSFTAASFKLGI